MIEGVQFEDEAREAEAERGGHLMYARVVASNTPPRIITWLIKRGVVSTEQGALNFLFFLAGVSVLLGFLFYMWSGSNFNETSNLPPAFDVGH